MTYSNQTISQNYRRAAYQRFGKLAAGIAMTFGVTLAAQAGALSDIQNGWAEVMYQSPEASRVERLNKLAESARKLTAEQPGQAGPLIWEGIVLSSLAGAKGGLGALGIVKQAKERLEAAMKIDRHAMNASAVNSLGVLYHKVPGWPIGFGSDKKAESLLREALQVNPNGIDPNFFYGEFLADEDRPEEAIQYLQRAVDAPARAGRELADQGRRAEARALLARLSESVR